MIKVTRSARIHPRKDRWGLNGDGKRIPFFSSGRKGKNMASFSATPPADFPYMDMLCHDPPEHDEFNPSCLKHPSMDVGKRAKILAPFNALCGFDDALAAREMQYEPFRELDEERASMLNRKLSHLQALMESSRTARENRVRIAVTYFCPCNDSESEGNGIPGQYRTVAGMLKKMDPVRRRLLLDDQWIDLEDVYDIPDPSGTLFHQADCSEEPDPFPDEDWSA